MSFTCQQCGATSTQPLNFCRRCGAPAQTAALGTSSLTTQLGTTDPLDTWEPTKPAVATAAATEALPAVSPAAVALPLVPSQPDPPASKAPAAAPRTTWRGVAVAAAGLLAVVAGGGYFLFQRPSAPAVESATMSAPAATASPVTVTPTPAPTVELAVALPASTPTLGSTAVNAKPAAGNKTESKPTAAALPAPTPNANTAAKSPASEFATEKPATPAPRTEEPKLSLLEQGNQLASAGQLQEAIQAYEKARRANPGNADVYYLLGSAYHRTGDLAKALEAYRQCTSGNYAGVAANHVRNLEKKLSKTPKSQAFTP